MRCIVSTKVTADMYLTSKKEGFIWVWGNRLQISSVAKLRATQNKASSEATEISLLKKKERTCLEHRFMYIWWINIRVLRVTKEACKVPASPLICAFTLGLSEIFTHKVPQNFPSAGGSFFCPTFQDINEIFLQCLFKNWNESEAINHVRVSEAPRHSQGNGR